MDSDHQNSKNEGYYHPKRCRYDNNYLHNSAGNNRFRKSEQKRYKVKVIPIKKYSNLEILNLQTHPLSTLSPPSNFFKRKIIPVGKYDDDSWRLVPKTIKSDLDALTKALKGLLNKLTPTNFESIKSKITESFSREGSKVFAGLLLTKACMEVKYSEIYSQLSKSLIALYGYFKHDLLEACQKIFESQAFDAEDAALNKKKMLGLVSFIGELLKIRILSTKVMEFCCEELIKKNTETSAEGLCYLLSACSSIFESSKFKEKAHDYINVLQQRSSSYSSRIKFQIQDLVESRQIHNYMFLKNEKPTKINQ